VVAACGILCCGFSSSWSGVELRVMRPVCRMLQHPANRTHTEKTIERSSFFFRRGGYCCREDLVERTSSEFFFSVACKS